MHADRESIVDLSIASAQEISFTLSGGLGETETGGTTINIVPRTGGNRVAGQFFTSATGGRMFGKNNGTHQFTCGNPCNGTCGFTIFTAQPMAECTSVVCRRYRGQGDGSPVAIVDTPCHFDVLTRRHGRAKVGALAKY